jgi:hypothetical protein
MRFSIDIKESEAEISKKILQSLSTQVDLHFRRAYTECKGQIVDIVTESITSHPTYHSLVSGQLRVEFGLDNATSRLNEILQFWKYLDLVYQKPKIKSNQIVGSFSLSMIKSDFSDVLSTAGAVVNTSKGSSLEWLRWLLLFGDKTIINNYEIKLGPNAKSRTGNAVMVGKNGSRWSVPPAFAGTEQRNWITEAIDNAEDDIMSLLKRSLGV